MPWWGFALAAVMTYGVGNTLVVKLFQKIPFSVYYLWSGVFQACLLPITYLVIRNLGLPWKPTELGSVPLFMSVVLTGVMGGGMFLLSLNRGQDAVSAGLIQLTSPFWTALACWIILGDSKLTPYTMLGGALIALGVYCLIRNG